MKVPQIIAFRWFTSPDEIITVGFPLLAYASDVKFTYLFGHVMTLSYYGCQVSSEMG